MGQFTVIGETQDGKRFDIGVLAYDENDARYAAKLVCGRGRRGIKILHAERNGA